MEHKYRGWIIERMEEGHFNLRPETEENWTDGAEKLKFAKEIIDFWYERRSQMTTYEKCLEFCQKQMCVLGYFPHEIEEAAKEMYEDRNGIDGEESEWFDEYSAWVEKNPGVMG